MRVISNEVWNKLSPGAQTEIEALTRVPEAPNKNKMAMLFPIVRDFNFIIGLNFDTSDRLLIFGDEPVAILEKADIFDLLVKSGCFPSKKQAQKNWQGIREIPWGYTEIGPIGKSKVMICVMRY